MKTWIWRHRKENLRKCSLRGLETRDDLLFFRYPTDPLPNLEGVRILTVEGPLLTSDDASYPLLLIDGTWRYANKMLKQLPKPFERRSLPSHFVTAYTRRQEVEYGLASVEALYLAHHILGREVEGLLDHYHWKGDFLLQNRGHLK